MREPAAQEAGTTERGPPSDAAGVSDFIWQLAASERSSRTAGEAGRSPGPGREAPLGHLGPVPHGGRGSPAPVPPRLTSLVSLLVSHRCAPATDLGCGCAGGWRAWSCPRQRGTSPAQPPARVVLASLGCLCKVLFLQSELPGSLNPHP